LNDRFVLNEDLSVIFDLDGTLVDTAPDLCQSLNFVLHNAGLKTFRIDEMRPHVGQGAKGLISRALSVMNVSIEADQLELWTQDFIDYYREHIADLSQPFPGLQPMLSRLAARRVKMGICTNKREELSYLLLDKLDLTRYFPIILGADSLPVRKPQPQHLLQTIEDLAGAPGNAIFVGDSETDTKTAKAAGIPIIGVTFGYSETAIHDLEPDHVIEHFDQLECAIEALAARAR